jgi:hypothetical protein
MLDHGRGNSEKLCIQVYPEIIGIEHKETLSTSNKR